MKQTAKEIYYWYKEHGICVICHQADAIRGQVRCPNCRDEERERQKKLRESIKGEERVEYLKKKREQNKCRYAEKKRLGICAECKRMAMPGYSRCSIHIVKQKNKRIEKAGWKAPNECLYCHEPRVEGFSFCSFHLPQRQEIGRKVGHLPVSPQHPWLGKYKTSGDI